MFRALVIFTAASVLMVSSGATTEENAVNAENAKADYPAQITQLTAAIEKLTAEKQKLITQNEKQKVALEEKAQQLRAINTLPKHILKPIKLRAGNDLGERWGGLWKVQQQQGCTLDANPPCNPAKCAGDTQNNAVLSGGLDCSDKGEGCIDNLSSGSFYYLKSNGNGSCKFFDGEEAAIRKTTRFDQEGHARDGVISKMFIAHPQHTPKKFGVIGAKRLRCYGGTWGTCHVYKTGYCIKCPFDVFASTKEHEATQNDFNKFYQCCIRGENSYMNTNGINKDCPSQPQTGSESYDDGAFTYRNNADATIKPEYKCSDGTVDGKGAQRMADAIILAA